MNVETLYNQYWQSGLHTSATWSPQWFQRYMGQLVGLESVLDYGCGFGCSYQPHLSRAVKNYVGADVSDTALENARQKGLKAIKIDPESGRVDLEDSAVEGATCIEVLEHLYDPLQAARELFRVMKPGGTLIVTVPNFGYHECRLLALLRAQVPSEPSNVKLNRYNGVHIRYFSKLMLKRLVRDAGFTDIRVGSFDDASIWDVFRAGGHFGIISAWARRYLPSIFHLRFMQNVWPNFFAKRLHVIARKPLNAK